MPWKDWWEKEKGGETKHMVKRRESRGGVGGWKKACNHNSGSQSQRGR